jgi:hypothetical protein
MTDEQKLQVEKVGKMYTTLMSMSMDSPDRDRQTTLFKEEQRKLDEMLEAK